MTSRIICQIEAIAKNSYLGLDFIWDKTRKKKNSRESVRSSVEKLPQQQPKPVDKLPQDVIGRVCPFIHHWQTIAQKGACIILLT